MEASTLISETVKGKQKSSGDLGNSLCTQDA